MNLTSEAVAKLSRNFSGSEQIVFDEKIPGFGLRMRAGGSRAWVFQYKLGEKHRRITFGKYPAMGSDAARKQAKEYHAKVGTGADPASDKQTDRRDASKTFDALRTQFLAFKQERMRPRAYQEIERHLLRHAAPLDRLQVNKIDRKDVASLLNAVASNSGRVTSNRVRSSLSSFFAWAMTQDEGQKNNPVVGTAKEEEQERQRVLIDQTTDDFADKWLELRAVWKAAAAGEYGTIVKLLILTGQRREEIAGLRWSEIKFASNVILLPASRTKNKLEHAVPMSPEVRTILESLPRRAGRDHVFGRGDGGYSGWSRSKERLDEALPEVGEWTLHDLRRTTATGMAIIGIQPHIVEAVLNHVSGHKAGVAGIYNVAQYLPEKADALRKWARHVMTIAGEGKSAKVVRMARSR